MRYPNRSHNSTCENFEGSAMKTVFDQTTLRGISLKNHFFRSATWMAMAEDGMVTDAIVDLYRNYAQGQVAGIISGFTNIDSVEAAPL